MAKTIITIIMISIQITVISYDYSLIFNDKNNKVMLLHFHILQIFASKYIFIFSISLEEKLWH